MTIDDISYLDPESINGLNLYAYCGNNPVMGYDPTGHWDWNLFCKVSAGVLLVGALIGATVFTGGIAGTIATIALSAAAGGFVGGFHGFNSTG